MFRVDEIIKVQAAPNTVPGANVADLEVEVQIRGVVGDDGENIEEFWFGLVPQDMGVNANKVRSELSLWLGAGNTIPTYVETVSREMVNEERDRRIETGTTINGIPVTGRPKDFNNMNGLALKAQRQELRGDQTLFVFMDANNNQHTLTPSQIIDLAEGFFDYVSNMYAAGWVLKATSPIPTTYKDNSHWPS